MDAVTAAPNGEGPRTLPTVNSRIPHCHESSMREASSSDVHPDTQNLKGGALDMQVITCVLTNCGRASANE
jgi:hypothetical protein